MDKITEITMAGGIQVTVPDSLDLMTPYVLREREDWFEDEIKFLRVLLQPGARVIDIGANYGLYTLSMAKTIGESGKLWAVEPCSDTYACLVKSITRNGLAQVNTVQCALSDHEGTARLRIEDNSELNSLAGNTEADSGKTEEVKLTTLDLLSGEQGLNGIDFVKLDAEGEEKRILDGAKEFFDANDPLVMFELKHGEQVNIELIDSFLSLGMNTFRLVPGLDLLVPFNKNESVDYFQLNLFACRDEKKRDLVQNNFLVDLEAMRDLDINAEVSGKLELKKYIDSAFARPLLREGYFTVDSDLEMDSCAKAIGLYYLAQDRSQPARIRLMALRQAYEIMVHEYNANKDIYRLSTLTRIALALGNRKPAVDAIEAGLTTQQQKVFRKPDQPFLPILPHYDEIEPGDSLQDWMFSQFLDAYDSTYVFTSYFSNESSADSLDLLRRLGYLRVENERRRQLIGMRFRSSAAPSPQPALMQQTDRNLNAEYWSRKFS